MRRMRGFAAAYRAAKKAEKQQKEMSWLGWLLMALIIVAWFSIPLLYLFIVRVLEVSE
jgi:hypothetical protein